MIQRRVFVSGRVQGVGFRASTTRQAGGHLGKGTGLRGFVRNLPDGRVEAVFCGEEETVRALVEWCRKGPRLAEVSGIEVKEEEPDVSLPPFDVSF